MAGHPHAVDLTPDINDDDPSQVKRFGVEIGIVASLLMCIIVVNVAYVYRSVQQQPIKGVTTHAAAKKPSPTLTPTITPTPTFFYVPESPTPEPKSIAKMEKIGLKMTLEYGWLLKKEPVDEGTPSATLTNGVYTLTINKDPVATGSSTLLYIPSNSERKEVSIKTKKFIKETSVINRSIVPNNYAASSLEQIDYPKELPLGRYFNGAVFYTPRSLTVSDLGIEIMTYTNQKQIFGITYGVERDFIPTTDNLIPESTNIKKYENLNMNSETYMKAISEMDLMLETLDWIEAPPTPTPTKAIRRTP